MVAMCKLTVFAGQILENLAKLGIVVCPQNIYFITDSSCTQIWCRSNVARIAKNIANLAAKIQLQLAKIHCDPYQNIFHHLQPKPNQTRENAVLFNADSLTKCFVHRPKQMAQIDQLYDWTKFNQSKKHWLKFISNRCHFPKDQFQDILEGFKPPMEIKDLQEEIGLIENQNGNHNLASQNENPKMESQIGNPKMASQIGNPQMTRKFETSKLINEFGTEKILFPFHMRTKC